MSQFGGRDGGQVGAREWGWFWLCVALWGSAYAMVEMALAHAAHPFVIVAGRLWLATGMLTALLRFRRARGQEPPPTPGIQGKLVVLGLFGAAAPFALLSFSQQTIPSNLAGILAAITPILVGVTAPLVTPGDRVTLWRMIGLALGFAGVLALMGLEALAGIGGPALIGQLAAAGAAISYAVNTLFARAGPAIPSLEGAAGWTFYGALMATPFAVWALVTQGGPDWIGWAFILLLAIGPTAIASVVFFHLLRVAGPAFITQTNYAIPVWAVVVGALAFGETLPPATLVAAALIGLGLYVAQEGWRSRRREAASS